MISSMEQSHYPPFLESRTQHLMGEQIINVTGDYADMGEQCMAPVLLVGKSGFLISQITKT